MNKIKCALVVIFLSSMSTVFSVNLTNNTTTFKGDLGACIQLNIKSTEPGALNLCIKDALNKAQQPAKDSVKEACSFVGYDLDWGNLDHMQQLYNTIVATTRKNTITGAKRVIAKDKVATLIGYLRSS